MAVFQWSGSIQFGLIPIAVRAKSAVKTEKLSFEMLHNDPECHGNAGYSQDWSCKACGEKIERTDTLKGWKGKPVDSAFLATLKAAKSKIIEIDRVVPASEIDPRYYQQSYDVTPEEGAEKVYVLFAKLLERSGKVAIATTVLGDTEQMVAIRPRDGILSMELMYWPEDLARAGRDVVARERVADITVTDQELTVGDMLMGSMTGAFDPSRYRDVYKERVQAYLTTVENDEAAPVAPKALEPKGAGMDLLAALQASINAATPVAAPETAEVKIA